MFSGTWVAVTTPFKDDGSVEREILATHIKYLSNYVDGFVLFGTTGEGISLTDDERLAIMQDCANSKPIIAGISQILPEKACAHARQAQGYASGIMLTPPYYIKPTTDDMHRYFKLVHDNTDMPIVLYNNPARFSVDIPSYLVAELVRECPRIVAIKNANTSPESMYSMSQVVPVFAGEDSYYHDFLRHKAVGIISTGANIAPHWYREILNAWLNNDLHTLDQSKNKIADLCRTLSDAPSPVGLKYMMSKFNLSSAALRFPLACPLKLMQKIDEYCKTTDNLTHDTFKKQ